MRVCPVPWTEDIEASEYYAIEQSWETYHTPYVAGGISDQPPDVLRACEIIRSVRNQYRNKRQEEMKEKLETKGKGGR